MELNLNKQPVAACELLFDSAAEQPIECDVLLPDYCPDIVRVLNCRVDTVITDCMINKTALTVEGSATVEICYAAEVGGIRKAAYKLPFSRSFELKRQPNKPMWTVNSHQGHVNCRAASKRRLEVRAAVVISAKVYDMAGQQVITGAEGCGVVLCQSEKPAVLLNNQILRRITMVEALLPPAGKEPAAEIVAISCTPMVSEARIMASRILLKGELTVHLLYKTDPDEGSLQTADYNLPISQIIDEQGLEDNIRCEALLQTISADCTIDDIDDGAIRLEVQLMADIKLFSPITLYAAADSFSTLYPTESDAATVKVLKKLNSVCERKTIRESLPLPDAMTSLLDIRADILEQATEIADEKAVINCKIKFSGLISTEDMAADTFSHICTAQIDVPINDVQSELLLTPVAVKSAGKMGTEQLELECELMICGSIMEWEKQSYLTELSVDESSPKTADPSIGLIVYYADKGESVWKIAKTFAVLPERIMADNDLKADVIETPMPIVIPTV